MSDIKKRGQPKKNPEDKKVPLTFHVKQKNHARIRARVKPIVQQLDTKEEDYL